MKRQLRGFLALLTAGVIFGSFGIWIRYLSKELTTYQQIGLRSLIGFCLTLILIIFSKNSLISLKKAKLKHLIPFTLLMPISIIFFVLAFTSTKMVVGIFSFYVGSILSSLIIGLLVFKEKLSGGKIVSLLLVFVGLKFFILRSGVNSFEMGIVYALISGFFDAVTNAYRKYLGNKIDRLVLTGLPLFGGIILMSALIFASGQTLTPQMSVFSWSVALLFGLLLFSVNYLLNYGFKNFDLNLGTIVVSSEVFFASLFGFLVFQEIPVWNELVGGIFILMAIVVTNLKVGVNKNSRKK